MGGKLTDFTTHEQASKSKQTKRVRREASVLSTTAAQVLFFFLCFTFMEYLLVPTSVSAAQESKSPGEFECEKTRTGKYRMRTFGSQ